MNALIALTRRQIGDAAVETVSARDLHAFLQVATSFKDWISRRVADYGFRENSDFCSFLSESQGGRPAREYSERVKSGDLEHKVTTVAQPDGYERVTEQVRITPAGLAKLERRLGYHPNHSRPR